MQIFIQSLITQTIAMGGERESERENSPNMQDEMQIVPQHIT
jgi:hypothetical protein